jgi:hypothetical protein
MRNGRESQSWLLATLTDEKLIELIQLFGELVQLGLFGSKLVFCLQLLGLALLHLASEHVQARPKTRENPSAVNLSGSFCEFRFVVWTVVICSVMRSFCL